MIWNSAWCVYGFATACQTGTGRRAIFSRMIARSYSKRSQLELASDYLISEAGHIAAIYNLFQYPFGGNDWWLRDRNKFFIRCLIQSRESH